jgi:uncharacterized repeat protein (TIGR01451 family)
LGGSNPAVVYNPKLDRFFVSYRRTYSGSQKPGILGQIVHFEGNLDDNDREIQIQTAGNDLPTAPVLAYDGTNSRYLVAWTVGGTISGSLLEGADPSAIGTAISMASNAQHPALAFNSQSGEYLLAYDAFSTATNSQDIFAKRFSATGQTVDNTAITVTSDASNQTSPRVAYNPDDNEFAVVWSDPRNTATSGQNTYGRIVSAQGTLTATELPLVTYSSTPVLGWAQSEQLYLLGWIKQRPTAAKDGFLFGRLLGSDLSGSEFPAVFPLSERGGATAGARAIAFDAANSRALGVWTRSGGSGQSVVAQLLDLSVRVTTMTLRVKDQPDPVKSGGELTYTISATNTGTATARGVVVTDTLPLGASYTPPDPAPTDVAISCTTPPDEQTPAVCTCDLDTIKPGATKKFELPVTLQAEKYGTAVNKAVLDWSNRGSSRKTRSTKTQVIYPGSLAVTAPAEAELLHPGDEELLTWQIGEGVEADSFEFKTYWSANNGKTWKPLSGSAVRVGQEFLWNQPWTVPAVAGNRPQALIRVDGTATVTVGGETAKVAIASADSQPFTIEVVKLTAPDDADPVDAGSPQTVSWNYYGTTAPVNSVQLHYSLDNGRHWKLIKTANPNPAGSETWSAPLLTRNATKARVRVRLLDSRGKSVGSDVSDASFPIRVLELTGPSGAVSGGASEAVSWQTYGTSAPVDGWKLQLSKDNGGSWKTVGEGSGNPEAHNWTVPNLKRQAKRCKLRLILEDAGGKRVAVDTQTQPFSILP